MRQNSPSPPTAPTRYSSAELLTTLSAQGYRWFTGVPCSLFGDLFTTVAEDNDWTTVPATREDLAIGTAAGLALSGQRPVVAMQNSAVGMIGNAVSSLLRMYGIHVLLLISWRGEGADAPEHIESGRQMIEMLDLMGIRHEFAADASLLRPDFFGVGGPVALIVRRGEMSDHA
ncbi:thiamine pyrophosphate-binding protein [Kribbella sp. NPDC056345]|uniref:thiamine pyrophosphate-binding protein n=1 Tax=Kribbella sp. NPDC056345 TaxID=3345789 RepID=UPI0035E14D8A